MWKWALVAVVTVLVAVQVVVAWDLNYSLRECRRANALMADSLGKAEQVSADLKATLEKERVVASERIAALSTRIGELELKLKRASYRPKERRPVPVFAHGKSFGG